MTAPTIRSKRSVYRPERARSEHGRWMEKGHCASVSVAGDWCELKAGHAPVENAILDGSGMHRSGGLQWEGTAR